MKKEIADQWTKALRSGDYKQGDKTLKTEDCFCVLGVLCEISNVGYFLQGERKYIYMIDGEHGKTGQLPTGVMKWAGIESEIGVAKNQESYPSLVYMNDYSKDSFSQIADYIDLNYQNL